MLPLCSWAMMAEQWIMKPRARRPRLGRYRNPARDRVYSRCQQHCLASSRILMMFRTPPSTGARMGGAGSACAAGNASAAIEAARQKVMETLTAVQPLPADTALDGGREHASRRVSAPATAPHQRSAAGPQHEVRDGTADDYERGQLPDSDSEDDPPLQQIAASQQQQTMRPFESAGAPDADGDERRVAHGWEGEAVRRPRHTSGGRIQPAEPALPESTAHQSSQRAVSPAATAVERAALPPSPAANSDERSRRSRRRPPAPSPDTPGLPPGPDSPAQRHSERAAQPTSPLPSRCAPAPADVAFQREELPQSPPPRDGALAQLVEPAEAMKPPAGSAPQREELPRLPSPSGRAGSPSGASLFGVGFPASPSQGRSSPAKPVSAILQHAQLPATSHPAADSMADTDAAFQREELSLSPTPPPAGRVPDAPEDPPFQREELPLSPASSDGARAAAGRPVFQRLELPSSLSPITEAGAAQAGSEQFERVELPLSPLPGGHACDDGALFLPEELGLSQPQMLGCGQVAGAPADFQREELPASPQPSEATRTASVSSGRRTGAGHSPGTSAAASAPQQQPVQAQSSGQTLQLSGPLPTSGAASMGGRSAKAIAWLQRRGKLPPMQARAHVALQ